MKSEPRCGSQMLALANASRCFSMRDDLKRPETFANAYRPLQTPLQTPNVWSPYVASHIIGNSTASSTTYASVTYHAQVDNQPNIRGPHLWGDSIVGWWIPLTKGQ